MLECMLEQVRRPLTAEERQRGKEETIRFYSVLDERLSKANLAPRKEAHGHVHNCAASLSSAFVAMNWPPAEDVLAYGPGLFQENNYSLTSMIGRSAGLDTPGVSAVSSSHSAASSFTLLTSIFLSKLLRLMLFYF